MIRRTSNLAFSKPPIAALTLLAALCLAVSIIVALPSSNVFAADQTPTVTYDAATGEFSYSNAPDGDLLANFKGLMPGDTVEQTVSIEVVNSQEVVAIYASAQYEDSEIEGIESVGLSVSFDETASQAGTLGDAHGMGDSVLLARFHGNGSQTGTVQVHVPPDLGNDTADTSHILTWQFTAQHEGVLPHDDGKPSDLAQTSDEAQTAICIASLAAFTAFACMITAVRRIRRIECI